jgi:hypothetical protein
MILFRLNLEPVGSPPTPTPDSNPRKIRPDVRYFFKSR